MRLPLKCVDLKSLITFLSVYTLLWIAKSLSLSYLDWVKMGKSCNGATNPVRTNFHFVSWLINGTGAALLFILYPLLWYLRFQSMNWLIYRELQMKQIFIAQTEFGKILRWLGSTTDTLVQNSDEEQQADDVFKWTLQN